MRTGHEEFSVLLVSELLFIQKVPYPDGSSPYPSQCGATVRKRGLLGAELCCFYPASPWAHGALQHAQRHAVGDRVCSLSQELPGSLKHSLLEHSLSNT